MKQNASKSNAKTIGDSLKLTTQNFGELCKARGFASVKEFARRLGRNDKTLWCAVRWPERYPATVKFIHYGLTRMRGKTRGAK